MEKEKVKARIYGNTLGTLNELIKLFENLDAVFTSNLAFDAIVERKKEKIRNVEEKLAIIEQLEEMKKNEKIVKELREAIDLYHKVDDFDDFSFDRYSFHSFIYEDKLKELIPHKSIYVSSVQFNSPGWWEVIANLSPLTNIRAYLDERHVRIKDKLLNIPKEQKLGELEVKQKEDEISHNEKMFELILSEKKLELEQKEKLGDLLFIEKEQEITKNNLEIAKQKIEILKELGYTDFKASQISNKFIIEPLEALDRHIESGQITHIEILSQD